MGNTTTSERGVPLNQEFSPDTMLDLQRSYEHGEHYGRLLAGTNSSLTPSFGAGELVVLQDIPDESMPLPIVVILAKVVGGKITKCERFEVADVAKMVDTGDLRVLKKYDKPMSEQEGLPNPHILKLKSTPDTAYKIFVLGEVVLPGIDPHSPSYTVKPGHYWVRAAVDDYGYKYVYLYDDFAAPPTHTTTLPQFAHVYKQDGSIVFA